MKHHKSTSKDLRQLFERAICIREIAEPLVSFDLDRDAGPILALMADRNFDVVGIREDGRMIGYVRRKDLESGSVRQSLIRFRKDDALAEYEPLLAAMQALRQRNELFITLLGQIGAIVTKGDLQKTPVRLWLFGLISLIEMQMLHLIRKRFPDGTWTKLLSSARLDEAKKTFAQRQQRNEEANVYDYSDCLYICDKATIFFKDKELSAVARFESKTSGRRFFGLLQSLRDDLAHSNDILNGRWPELAEVVMEGENLLLRLEAAG